MRRCSLDFCTQTVGIGNAGSNSSQCVCTAMKILSTGRVHTTKRMHVRTYTFNWKLPLLIHYCSHTKLQKVITPNPFQPWIILKYDFCQAVDPTKIHLPFPIKVYDTNIPWIHSTLYFYTAHLCTNTLGSKQWTLGKLPQKLHLI